MKKGIFLILLAFLAQCAELPAFASGPLEGVSFAEAIHARTAEYPAYFKRTARRATS